MQAGRGPQLGVCFFRPPSGVESAWPRRLAGDKGGQWLTQEGARSLSPDKSSMVEGSLFQGALLPDSVGSRCAGCGPCEAGSLPSLTLTFGASSASLPRTSPPLAPLPSCTRPHPPISTLGLAPPVHPASLHTPSSAWGHFGQLLCQERCLALVVERIRCFLPFFPGHACLDLFFPTSCVWSCPFYNTCVGFLLFCFLFHTQVPISISSVCLPHSRM